MPTLLELHALAKNCHYHFPNPKTCQADYFLEYGLIGFGGDLSPETLTYAYLQAIFPWFNDDESSPTWYSPTPRCVLVPDDFTPKRSLVATAKKSDYTITLNQAFERVAMACSLPRSYADSSWITTKMKAAYRKLHYLGVAHSIEVWQGKKLVGGLYGLKLGAVFCGESMFHKKTDCSKLAFWALTVLCRQTGVKLIDCQLVNDHLLSLGAKPMDRDEFLELFEHLTDLNSEVAVGADDWQGLEWGMSCGELVHFK